MPIEFQPAAPMAPGVSQGYGAVDMYQRFLPAQLQQQEMQQHTVDRIAQQGQEQQRFAQNQALQQQHAQQQAQLQQVQFSQADRIQLARTQQANSQIDQQEADGTLDHETAQSLRMQVAGVATPLQQKQAQSTQKQIKDQDDWTMHQTAGAYTRMKKNVADFLQDPVSKWTDPTTGETHQLVPTEIKPDGSMKFAPPKPQPQQKDMQAEQQKKDDAEWAKTVQHYTDLAHTHMMAETKQWNEGVRHRNQAKIDAATTHGPEGKKPDPSQMDNLEVEWGMPSQQQIEERAQQYLGRHTRDTGKGGRISGSTTMKPTTGPTPGAPPPAPTVTPSQPPSPGPDLVRQQMAKLEKLEAQLEAPPSAGVLDPRSEAQRQHLDPHEIADAKAAIAGLRDLAARYGDFNAPGVPEDVRKKAKEFIEKLRRKQPPRMTAAEGERVTGGRYFGGKQ